jgi:hypothetical protein
MKPPFLQGFALLLGGGGRPVPAAGGGGGDAFSACSWNVFVTGALPSFSSTFSVCPT